MFSSRALHRRGRPQPQHHVLIVYRAVTSKSLPHSSPNQV